MPMTLFMERFREVGARETRSAKITEPGDLPVGEYGFLEYYCDEPGCDCRRVTIRVLRPETGWSKILATISYGWERADFYRKWSVAGSDPIEMQGPGLDRLNPQTQTHPLSSICSDSFLSRPDMWIALNGITGCSGNR